MPEVFLFIMFFIATFMAFLECTRAWGAKGALLAAIVQFGLAVALFVLASIKMPIPYGLTVPVISGFVLFRRAQTARFTQIAEMDDEQL